ncbi:MAG: hypothetical protein JSV04_03670 [Candidatus Heimdallarchaeota archaeon]|nr:MAG: hypothetical protein JSV04_03670 [Candidatus Heimdallarchaeota archaeon]
MKNDLSLVLLMSGVILLSGCVSSKDPLKVQLFREADNELEVEVLEYIELYDCKEFINNDEYLVHDLGYDVSYDRFIGNITSFLNEAKTHYQNLEISGVTGVLKYHIAILNLSSTDRSTLISQAKNTSIYEFSEETYPFPETSGLAVYFPRNSSQVVTKREINDRDSFLSDIIEEIELPNSFWVVVVRIGYTWGNRRGICGGYQCTEMIILGVNFNTLGMVVSGSSGAC